MSTDIEKEADNYFLNEKLYCKLCGSEHVQYMAWIDANTQEVSGSVNNPLEVEDCWCQDCEEHTALVTLKELWDMFSEIPINNNDEIETDFLNFEEGTSRFDVWHWFDERCPNNLHDDLLCGTQLQ